MRLWRIVKDPTGRPEDFLSAQAMGRKPRSEIEARLIDGLSMFDDPELAIRKANSIVRTPSGRKERVLGEYVVPLDLPPEMRIRYERTTLTEGHYTVWISPEMAVMLALWRQVRPVAPSIPNPKNSMEARVAALRQRQEQRRRTLPKPPRDHRRLGTDPRDGPSPPEM